MRINIGIINRQAGYESRKLAVPWKIKKKKGE